MSVEKMGHKKRTSPLSILAIISFVLFIILLFMPLIKIKIPAVILPILVSGGFLLLMLGGLDEKEQWFHTEKKQK